MHLKLLLPFSVHIPAGDSYHRQLLVTGAQRSGTHYTWEMLNRLGVDVHHEGVGSAGAVSWLYAVSVVFMPSRKVYAINNPEPLTTHRFKHIFHQVMITTSMMLACLLSFEIIRPRIMHSFIPPGAPSSSSGVHHHCKVSEMGYRVAGTNSFAFDHRDS